MEPQAGELGLYVHWPFCLSKCPYCDFNSHVAEQSVDAKLWSDCLTRELEDQAERFGTRPLTSIFFGGGTPSLMPPQVTEAVLDKARSLFGFANSIEISLEANPGTVDQARFEDFRAVGVNRLSLGVQSLDDTVLRFFERAHDAAAARKAIELARDVFGNVSADLIYARPDQSAAAWRAELADLLSYDLPHLSLYQLTIEPGTRFEVDVKRGLFQPLEDEDRQAELWDVAHEMTSAKGLENYEVSNFARPDFECAHNLIYWRGQDYLAIGPGAHGRVTTRDGTIAFDNEKMPKVWLSRMNERGQGLADSRLQTADERAFERLMMGLRIPEGVALSEVSAVVDQRALDEVIGADYLAIREDRLVVTEEGRLRLNAILAHIWTGS